MAYNTEILKSKAIELIKKHNLIFIDDITAMLGISTPCFYDHFKVDSKDFNELRELLNENKISVKTQLRKKWLDSENATTQMALYKLCSTTEEHKKLQQNYSDVTTQGEKVTMPVIMFTDGED